LVNLLPTVIDVLVGLQSCPGDDPDDTPHAPIPFFAAPDYVSYNTTDSLTEGGSLVDLIFIRFFAHDVIRAINEISLAQGSKAPNVTMDDISTYADLQTNEVLGLYAKLAWN
jgi:hypothetical protein